MYTMEKAAEELGVTVSTVAQYVQRRNLAFVDSRITAESLNAYRRRTIRNYDDIAAALAWDGWASVEARPEKIEAVLVVLKARVEFKSQVRIAQEMSISHQRVSQLQAWGIQVSNPILTIL